MKPLIYVSLTVRKSLNILTHQKMEKMKEMEEGEVLKLLIKLRKQMPEFYRHLIGLVKAILK